MYNIKCLPLCMEHCALSLKSCEKSSAIKYSEASFHRRHSGFVSLGLLNWVRERCLARIEEGISAPASYIINDGSFGMIGKGLIVDNDCILSESIQNISPRLLPQWIKSVAPSTIEIDCRLFQEQSDFNSKAFILDSVWNGNYGHWLLESVTILYMAIEGELDLGSATFFVGEHPQNMHGLWRETIELLIGSEASLQFNSPNFISFSFATWLSPATIHPWHYHNKCVEMGNYLARKVELEPHGLQSNKLGRRRKLIVFYSRRHDSSRSLLNEAEIVEFLKKKHDVQIIDKPHELTFRQRIALALSADAIVGITGAAMADMIFADNGIPVISLSPNNMPHDVYWQLASLKSMKYIAVGGASIEDGLASSPSEAWRNHFTLPLDLIIEAIEVAFS